MPESTEPTPRPWQRSESDDGYWEIRYHGDGIERALVEHVALFPIERDAQLCTDAVNAYDRLKKIEAAARQFVADWSDTTYDRASFAVDRDEWNVLNLRKALEIE